MSPRDRDSRTDTPLHTRACARARTHTTPSYTQRKQPCFFFWLQNRYKLPASAAMLDWLQSLKQFFIDVSYHILVASLTVMALF